MTLLVIEAESVTKAELQRAASSLRRLQAPAVSAIFNRVKLSAGDGFARAALTEFKTGTPPAGGNWLQRRFFR